MNQDSAATGIRWPLWAGVLGAILTVAVGGGQGLAQPGAVTEQRAAAPQSDEFFELRVRPLLAEHCFECHGPNKQEAGLRLDQADAARAGGDSGPVIVAGDPESSRLVQAIGYQDEGLQMPPDGKLSDEAIAAVAEWIRDGAAWPAAGEAASSDSEAWRSHWAFQPVGDPPPPAVEDVDWPQTPIDRFVLSRLEAAGLAPSPPADRRVLLRRLTFDLTGLPPSPEEMEAFIHDGSLDALVRVVDRLLESPAYGERWARHWLDVARYADNKGYKFFGSDEFYAYTYRDWVVRAFNEDMPYDEFVVRQLAADCLLASSGNASDTRSLAAMGYLTLGRRFLEDLHDIIDDRIDVITRGLMGLTVTCARCHDHKYDPIPTADYYSLYGVLAGSRERTRTLFAAGDQTPEQRAYERQLAMHEAALDDYLSMRHEELLAGFRSRAGEYLVEGHRARNLPPTDRFMFVEEPGKLSQLVISNWRAFLERTARGHDPVFAPWHAMADLPPEDFAAQAAVVVQSLLAEPDPGRPLNPKVAELLATVPAGMEELAARYGALLADVEKQWRTLLAQAAAAGSPAPARFEDEALEQLRAVLYGPLSPVDVPVTDVEFLVGRPGQQEINKLRKAIADFMAGSSLRPPRAMVLEEMPALYRYPPRVFHRGKPANLGQEVPRWFPAVLAGADRQPFSHASGRLEMARAIADEGNPLTARVLVNRVWMHHFGAALVDTPSDFGLRSNPPSHPELLDWLATQFMEQGWSIKKLHRMIVLSSVYQQRSDERPDALGVDPENRLLWRMNRRRLDLESLRDALLTVSGELDPAIGGLPVDIVNPPYSRRRTLYGYVDRTNLPGLFRTFDFAIPDTHSPRRYTTTVPQQALYLMNSAFVIEQARHLAARADVAAASDPRQRIERLYAICFGRPPAPDELELALAYIGAAESPSAPRLAAAWQYGRGRIDAAAGKVLQFLPLAHWTGSRWQGGPSLPDPAIGWVLLDATGGHPGDGFDNAVVRRWTADRAGTVSVTGGLVHEESEGDGIDARIISSRSGQLASWTVHNNRAQTDLAGLEVQPGDTLDFVVTSRGSVTCDQFLWAPTLRMELPATAAGGPAVAQWSATRDFHGAALEPWERYCHALLLLNEFTMLD